MSEQAALADLIINGAPEPAKVNWKGSPMSAGMYGTGLPQQEAAPAIPSEPALRQFVFEGDDGTRHIVEAPFDATPEQAFQYLRAQKPEVDRAATKAELQDAVMTGTKHLASAGTGTVRAIAAAGSSLPDLAQAIFPGPGGSLLSAGGKKVASTISDVVQPFLQEHLYQPQTQGERTTAATAAGGVSALSRNPWLVVPGMAGGALAQTLHEMPGGATGIEWLDKAIGRVGVPAAGMAVQVAPQLIGWGLHLAGLGKLGHLVDTMMTKLSGSGPREVPVEMDPRKIIGQEQAGQISSADADALFKARREKMLGPDEPPLPTGPSLSNVGPIPVLLAKLLRTFGLSPEIQYQATRQSFPPQAGP